MSRTRKYDTPVFGSVGVEIVNGNVFLLVMCRAQQTVNPPGVCEKYWQVLGKTPAGVTVLRKPLGALLIGGGCDDAGVSDCNALRIADEFHRMPGLALISMQDWRKYRSAWVMLRDDGNCEDGRDYHKLACRAVQVWALAAANSIMYLWAEICPRGVPNGMKMSMGMGDDFNGLLHTSSSILEDGAYSVGGPAILCIRRGTSTMFCAASSIKYLPGSTLKQLCVMNCLAPPGHGLLIQERHDDNCMLERWLCVCATTSAMSFDGQGIFKCDAACTDVMLFMCPMHNPSRPWGHASKWLHARAVIKEPGSDIGVHDVIMASTMHPVDMQSDTSNVVCLQAQGATGCTDAGEIKATSAPATRAVLHIMCGDDTTTDPCGVITPTHRQTFFSVAVTSVIKSGLFKIANDDELRSGAVVYVNHGDALQQTEVAKVDRGGEGTQVFVKNFLTINGALMKVGTCSIYTPGLLMNQLRQAVGGGSHTGNGRRFMSIPAAFDSKARELQQSRVFCTKESMRIATMETNTQNELTCLQDEICAVGEAHNERREAYESYGKLLVPLGGAHLQISTDIMSQARVLLRTKMEEAAAAHKESQGESQRKLKRLRGSSIQAKEQQVVMHMQLSNIDAQLKELQQETGKWVVSQLMRSE